MLFLTVTDFFGSLLYLVGPLVILGLVALVLFRSRANRRLLITVLGISTALLLAVGYVMWTYNDYFVSHETVAVIECHHGVDPLTQVEAEEYSIVETDKGEYLLGFDKVPRGVPLRLTYRRSPISVLQSPVIKDWEPVDRASSASKC